jgi:hypothetical protein
MPGWYGLDVERQRHRQVLEQRRRVEQHGARADDAESIERGQPVLAIGNRGGRAAGDDDLAFVRQRGAGDEIHEHFGRAGVESREGDPLAGGNRQVVDPQRPQPVVLLANGC